MKELLGLILIEILVDEKNRFEKREYFIVCRLLNAIKNYPLFRIPSTRVGLLLDHVSYMEEYLIRFEDDILWVGMEGVERTAMGSDSFERESLNLSHSFDGQSCNSNIDSEFHNILLWFNEARETLSLAECKITIECHNPG
jgi:hypothetical protein